MSRPRALRVHLRRGSPHHALAWGLITIRQSTRHMNLVTSTCLVRASVGSRSPRASSRRPQSLYTIASSQSLMTSSSK